MKFSILFLATMFSMSVYAQTVDEDTGGTGDPTCKNVNELKRAAKPVVRVCPEGKPNCDESEKILPKSVVR